MSVLGLREREPGAGVNQYYYEEEKGRRMNRGGEKKGERKERKSQISTSITIQTNSFQFIILMLTFKTSLCSPRFKNHRYS